MIYTYHTIHFLDVAYPIWGACFPHLFDSGFQDFSQPPLTLPPFDKKCEGTQDKNLACLLIPN